MDNLKIAYRKYCDSHYTPGNPKSTRFIEQIGSTIPIQHSFESFKNELETNKKFFLKWGKDCRREVVGRW